MRVEEVKTSFIANTRQYIADIQKAQKVLRTFVTSADTSLNKREAAEMRLQTATQRTVAAQAKAMAEEMKYKGKLVAANSKLEQSQNNVNKSISKSASSSRMFGSELAHLARNVMTLYYSLKTVSQVAKQGLEFNQLKEDAELAFTVMFRSADVAQQKIQELQKYAVSSPLSFKETIEASKQLTAYGFAADELIPSMKTLGTVAKAVGAPLNDIAYIYGTLRTQGRAYARDLMQFGQRGIPIYEALADVLDVNVTDIKKLTEEGKIGFREVEKAIKSLTTEGGRFAGLLDKYMVGFSGLKSQVEDFFFQSMGTLMKEAFDSMKIGMKDLIAILSGSDFTNTMSSLGREIGNFVSGLVPLVGALIKATPALIQFLKALLGFWVAKKIFTMFTALPTTIRLIGIELLTATKGLKAFNLASLASGWTKSFKTMLFAVTSFSKALWGVMAANPMLTAILGIVAAGSVITLIVKSQMDKKIAAERERVEELSGSQGLFQYDMAKVTRYMDIGNIQARLKEAGTFIHEVDYMQKNLGQGMKLVQFTYQGVQKIADAYGISALEAAKLLHTQGKLGDGLIGVLQLEEDWAAASREYFEQIDSNKDNQIQSWLETTTGAAKGAYALTSNIATIIHSEMLGLSETVFEPAGARAATAYISQMQDTLKSKEAQLQLMWADMYTPDMMEGHIQSAMDDVSKLLEEASKFTVMRNGEEVSWFDTTKWDENMRDFLASLRGQLKETGSEVKKLGKEMDKWFAKDWTQKAYGNTSSGLELQRAKDIDAANAKYAGKEITSEELISSLGAIFDKSIADLNRVKLDVAISGDPKFWEDWKAMTGGMLSDGNSFGAAASQFGMSMVQGTEVGNLMAGGAGGDPLMQFAMALAFAALEVEGVQEILNAFTTTVVSIMEVIAPVTSVHLLNLVSVIKELGESIGKILAPFIVLAGHFLNMFVGLLKLTVIPVLEILGAAFTMLNDYAIIPFANGFIDATNAVITGINSWLGWMGVNIALLERYKTSQELLVEELEQERLSSTMDYMVSKLNDMIDNELSSLQELYELGAITGEQYMTQAQDISSQRLSLEQNLVDVNVAQKSSIDAIYGWLVENGAFPSLEALLAQENTSNGIPAAYGSGAFLTNGNNSGTTTVNNYYVEGSLIAKDELLNDISNGLARQASRGHA